MVFKSLFGKKKAPQRRCQIPAGQRLYAIGDIHGRLDLLDVLLGKIAADNVARTPAHMTLIFLGDLPDRGPDSKGVIDRLIALNASVQECIFLAGNHEELMIRMAEGDRAIAPVFHRAGGRETLISYGVSADAYDSWDFDAVSEAAMNAIPQAHVDFLKSFTDWHRVGDYVFVHAGLRPGFAVEDQDVQDLRWIKTEFTKSPVDHGAMIIHGHSITDGVDEQPNRIGLDTGAYYSGVLTAMGFEADARWVLQTRKS
jgi:serine/threonine protein phosphatase 1